MNVPKSQNRDMGPEVHLNVIAPSMGRRRDSTHGLREHQIPRGRCTMGQCHGVGMLLCLPRNRDEILKGIGSHCVREKLKRRCCRLRRPNGIPPCRLEHTAVHLFEWWVRPAICQARDAFRCFVRCAGCIDASSRCYRQVFTWRHRFG